MYSFLFFYTELTQFLCYVTGSYSTISNNIEVLFTEEGVFFASTCSRVLELPLSIKEYDVFSFSLKAVISGPQQFNTI